MAGVVAYERITLLPLSTLDMLLVAVKRVTALLRPTGIHILMEFLVRIVIPQFVALALLYLRILLTSVALAWATTKLASMIRPR